MRNRGTVSRAIMRANRNVSGLYQFHFTGVQSNAPCGAQKINEARKFGEAQKNSAVLSRWTY
ncbi:hypothetical protein RSSM_06510 [Rhodopirellula sallentina SM41]|uniref:Uncharacterized protein n=1 Tax=Rhodopirellula sallentina SM41 TaxID=1263870 RepID=M5TSC8_9BACT|nr:hypothetical protein RSSM_06510 [Rhodopirellula sallentina SM41]